MFDPNRPFMNSAGSHCAIICICILILIICSVTCSPPQEAQFVATSSPPTVNLTEVQIRTNQSDPPSSRLPSRVLLIMKLLQLAHQYSTQHNSTTRSNAGPSESRSMSSWFRLRKPAQRQENQYLLERNGAMPNQGYQRNGQAQPSPPLFPPAMPNNYNNFGKPHDPNSFFFVPSLTDTSGIDYWLKFIEEANLDDRNAQLFLRSKEKPSKLRPVSVGKRTKIRSKSKSGGRKTAKTSKDGKNGVSGDDYDSDLSGNNDLVLDTKPTDSTKALKQVVEYETSPRCDKFTDEICIDDFEYPEHAILDEIVKRKDIFQLMYSEVKGDAPMVDGIPRDEEENFSQDYYYNNNDNESEDYDGYPIPANRTHQDLIEDSEPVKTTSEKNNRGGGHFVCRSEVLYAKPKLARNIKGKWRVIVNAGDFTQTIRMEKCTKPNSECRFIADHKYDSRCAQISAIHRLLVFEKGKGFYIDTFRVPTACTCHVHITKSDEPKHFPVSGTSANVKRDKSNLGDTLWSLLGTEPDKSSHIKDNRNFMLLPDQDKAGLNLDLLKLLPQLTSIAPENVLQQLLEDYTDQNAQQKGYGKRVSNSYQLGGLLAKVPSAELQQLLLAHAQRGDISKEGAKRLSEKALSQPHPTTTTTTTIVNPSGGNGGPVVQVIHVPVSSEIVTSDDRGLSTRNRFRPMYSHHDTIKFPSKHSSKYHISTHSNYLQSQSKTNSSVAPPPLQAENLSQSSKKHVETVTDEKGTTAAAEENKDIKQILDKKINFSYHPILEYIVH